ncbi:MAG: hypothetical protein AAF483_11925 [Planctomycetota bacterium]
MQYLNLPQDLVSFYESGRPRQFSDEDCEAGATELFDFSELEIQRFPMETGSLDNCDDDPNRAKANSYLVPAVDLICSCTGGYDPTGLLLWLPEEGRFGTWDSSHCIISVFSDCVTWDLIEQSPAEYINAQWTGMYADSPPSEPLLPWLKYEYADQQIHGPVDVQERLSAKKIGHANKPTAASLAETERFEIFKIRQHKHFGNCSSFRHGPCMLGFGDGRSIESAVKESGFNFGLSRIPPKLDYFEVGTVPFVSQSLKELLDAIGAKAEYFYAGTKGQRSVFAINCTVGKNCVDKQASKWERDAYSGRNRIVEFVLNREKIPVQPLFMPRHLGFHHLCVTGSLKELLEANSLVMQFEPIEVAGV